LAEDGPCWIWHTGRISVCDLMYQVSFRTILDLGAANFKGHHIKWQNVLYTVGDI